MAKYKTYTIQLKVMVDTCLDIKADSYEDAIKKAREIGVKDVVDFDTDYNDGSIAVVGVYNFDEEPK